MGLLFVTVGCGDGPAPAPQTAAPSVTPEPAPPATGDTSSPSVTDSDDPKSKTKWISGIPYDVFYDQPLVVASDGSTAAPAANVAANPKSPEMTPAKTIGTSASTAGASPGLTAGGPDWTALISPEVLNEEVTRLRNVLTGNLNTLATYNRNIEQIASDGAGLAALAAVAEVHPGEVSWKDKAKYIRDLGYQIYTNADGTGRTPYDATKEPFEKIVAMLNGGPPPDLEADDQVPFTDVADRSELMKRIKKSYDYLRAEINTEARFKETPDDIVREASVLASFGGMISTGSYDSATEEKYRQFVRDFIQANVDVADATKSDDFAKFEDAKNRIQKACDACHAEYAFGDEGF